MDAVGNLKKAHSGQSARVQIVVDSASNLSSELAEQWGIHIHPLEVMGAGAEVTTSGAHSLELAALYGRLVERSQGGGVIAIHLSQDMSSTWSAAVHAASVFHGSVVVLDTRNAGMSLGAAAIAAAHAAHQGADLHVCVEKAQQVLAGSQLWLYPPKLDPLRRGGRLSTMQTFVPTALSMKVIINITEGRLELAAKARTEKKALERISQCVVEDLLDRVKKIPQDQHGNTQLTVYIQHAEAVDKALSLKKTIETNFYEGSQKKTSSVPLKEVTLFRTKLSTRGLAYPSVKSPINAEEKGNTEEENEVDIPSPRYQLKIHIVPMSPVVIAHVGSGSVGITVVQGDSDMG